MPQKSMQNFNQKKKIILRFKYIYIDTFEIETKVIPLSQCCLWDHGILLKTPISEKETEIK